MKTINQSIFWPLGWLVIGLAVWLAGPAYAQAATLKLSPNSGNAAGGSSIEIKILLDTGGVTTSGTDAYVRFDPNSLQVIDANAATEGVQILPGSLYSQTSYNLVDNAAGKISFSGSKSGGSPGYSGSGTLATITFQVVAGSGSTDVTFDYTAGSTTDSNVIDQASSEDVLSSVTNAKFTLTGGTGTGTGNDSLSGSGSLPNDSLSGASGNTGTDGSGGSGTVAGTGLDLEGYMVLTVLSAIGALFFLTRRSKRPSA